MTPESMAALKAAKQKPLLDNYYTRSQLADELDITVRTLERWAWLRSGPNRTYIGNRVYYHRSAVEEWLAKQTEASS